MKAREAAELGQSMGFTKYSPTAHSLANRPEETGVMRVPQLEQAINGKKRKKQTDVVMEYMDKFGGITSMQAYHLGITRLADVVFKLRKAGVVIETIPHVANGTTYAEYRRV